MLMRVSERKRGREREMEKESNDNALTTSKRTVEQQMHSWPFAQVKLGRERGSRKQISK